MSAWPNLKALCVALGDHGISPDSLETVGKIAGYLEPDTRAEYEDFMAKARVMFAPRDDEPEYYDHPADCLSMSDLNTLAGSR